jgi:hypothetical protein
MNTNGFVYFFGPGEFSDSDALWTANADYGIEIKIGHTHDPKNCLQQLRRARPSYGFWDVIFAANCAPEFERALHAFYRNYRRGGEFFALPVSHASWWGSFNHTEICRNSTAMLAFLWDDFERHFGLSVFHAQVALQNNPFSTTTLNPQLPPDYGHPR